MEIKKRLLKIRDFLPDSKRSTRVPNQLASAKCLPDSKRSNSRLHLDKIRLIPKCKRSQGEIVATILLILLTITATAIIIQMVIPFVNNQISKGDCFDFVGKLEIGNSNTCYDSTNKVLRVEIVANDLSDKSLNSIKSIKISITKASGSESFEIADSFSDPPGRVSMSNGIGMAIPKNNQGRVYNITSINETPKTLVVYPIITNKRSCSEANSVISNVNKCF